MIYSLYFTIFSMFYPQNYLGYFVQGELHLPTTQRLLWRQGIKLQALLGFENFQLVAHGFLGCQNLEKSRTFHLGQFLMNKKISGYFAIAEYVISRHISSWICRIYIVLYGYKLFLTSYVGLKIRKNKKIFASFVFLSFLALREEQ